MTNERAVEELIAFLLDTPSPGILVPPLARRMSAATFSERAYGPSAYGGPWPVAVEAVRLTLRKKSDRAPCGQIHARVLHFARALRSLCERALEEEATAPGGDAATLARFWKLGPEARHVRRSILDELTAQLCEALSMTGDAVDFRRAWHAARVLSLPPPPASPEEADEWIATFFEAVTRDARTLRTGLRAPVLALATTEAPRFAVPNLARSFLDLRAGAGLTKPAERWRGDERIFRVPGARWIVLPPAGHTLLLPFEKPGNRPPQTTDLRQAASPGVIRAWLASWALWHLQGRDPSGLFSRNILQIMRDVFGMKGGRGKAREALAADFDCLPNIAILGAESEDGRRSISLSTAEPLLQCITARENHGSHSVEDRLYRHAPTVLQMLQGGGQFLQLPFAAMRLSGPGDTAIALGLATWLRARFVDAGRTGELRAPLADALVMAGVDVVSGARKGGRAFWTASLARLVEVAAAADLGTIYAAKGDAGAATPITLTPSLAMSEAYAPMAGRHLDRKAAKQAAELLPAPPPGGKGKKRRRGVSG